MGNFIKLVLFKWNIVIIPGMWMCFLGVVVTSYILENSLLVKMESLYVFTFFK